MDTKRIVCISEVSWFFWKLSWLVRCPKFLNQRSVLIVRVSWLHFKMSHKQFYGVLMVESVLIWRCQFFKMISEVSIAGINRRCRVYPQVTFPACVQCSRPEELLNSAKFPKGTLNSGWIMTDGDFRVPCIMPWEHMLCLPFDVVAVRCFQSFCLPLWYN